MLAGHQTADIVQAQRAHLGLGRPADVALVIHERRRRRGAEDPLDPGPDAGEDFGEQAHVRAVALVDEVEERQLPVAGHDERARPSWRRSWRFCLLCPRRGRVGRALPEAMNVKKFVVS